MPQEQTLQQGTAAAWDAWDPFCYLWCFFYVPFTLCYGPQRWKDRVKAYLQGRVCLHSG